MFEELPRTHETHTTCGKQKCSRTFATQKGSSRKLTVDHQAHSLNVCYQYDNNENIQTHDLALLSNGAHSYVMLALLVASGQRAKSPFHVMDKMGASMDSRLLSK